MPLGEKKRNRKVIEYIARENYFLIGVPRTALSQTVIAQDQVVRARLRDVTVHQACVLVRGIVITLRHSSKSVFPDERLKDSFFNNFHYVLLWYSQHASPRLFLERAALTLERRKKCRLNGSFDSIFSLI